jgi:hypothetical protein
VDAVRISAALGAFRLPQRASTVEAPAAEEARPPASRPADRSEIRRPQPPGAAEFRPPPRSTPEPEGRRSSGARGLPESAAAKRVSATPKPSPAGLRERAFDRILEASIRSPGVPGGLRLSLRSEEWGELRIDLIVTGAEVRASVLTQCEAARQAILSELDELRARLEDRGLRLGEFRVDVQRQDPAAEEPALVLRSARPQVLDVIV